MANKKLIGLVLLGVGVIAYLGRRTVNAVKVIFESLHIKEVYTNYILFQIGVQFYNPLFVDVKIDSFSGKIYLMGRYVSTVESDLNLTLLKRTHTTLYFTFKATPQELGAAIWDNIQTGDIKTLTARFEGYLEVNKIRVPVNKTFTFDDLFSTTNVNGVEGLNNNLLTADGKDQFLKFGNNYDVQNYVKQCYEKWRDQPMLMVEELKGLTIIEQCQQIFWHVIENVNYVVDQPGSQYIKSPARLIADKSGDCKSMTIFIASCLHCLGIKHAIRFVNFDGGSQYTHVYPIAFDENQTPIILDCVERDAQGKPIFNYAREFSKNKDLYYAN